MDKDISRREFLKIMGVGGATIALGTTLTGCNRDLDQFTYGTEMGYEELANYYYVEFASDTDKPSYLVVREKELGNNKYNYYSLIVNERNKNFQAKKIDSLDLSEFDQNKEHIPMEAFNYFHNTITCEPIIDIFNEEIGVQPIYKVKDYKYALQIVEQKLEKNKTKPKVKKM